MVPEIWQFCLKRILTQFSDIPTGPANSCGRGNHPALPKTWPVINCKFSHSIRCLLKCFLRHFFESFKIYQIWKELLGAGGNCKLDRLAAVLSGKNEQKTKIVYYY